MGKNQREIDVERRHNLENLLHFCRLMREAQKTYFKERDGANLEKAKKYEKIVDSYIRQIDSQQETLF